MEPGHKKILITDNIHLTEIQKAFHDRYPYLKMEFSLANGINVKAPPEIDITGDKTVAQVIESFNFIPGVTVQVYRKCGNVWNAISLTDGWTLERQNAEGAMISEEMGRPR